MTTTITTTLGTTSPTRFGHQRKLDRCRNGVLWALIIIPQTNQLQFHWSANNGATWTEDTTRRIDDVNAAAGASMRIATRADGAERLGVVYIRNNHVRVNLGRFRDNRQSFVWQDSNVIASTAGQSSFWNFPDLELVPLGGSWVMPVFWSRRIDDKAYLWWTRVKWPESGSGNVNKARVLHERTATIQTRPSVAVRHLGDDEQVHTASPHLYVAWAHGAPGDPQPRQYLMRMTSRGTTWDKGTVRVLREAGVLPGQTAAAYTGKAFAAVRAPYDDGEEDPATLQLHVMDPTDAVREAIDVPALEGGNIAALGVSWDNASGDIFIIASGTGDQNPKYIRYIWAPRQFDPAGWTTINADGANGDSISVKPGSRAKRIEIIYSVVNGVNRNARYELAATVNSLPTAATWVTATGAKDRTAQLILQWQHNDPDGDVQAAYTLQRRVNDEDLQYWNGATWQSSLVNITSATQQVTLAAGWAATNGDVIAYRVRTSDAGGFGPWSPVLPILASTAVDPTITSPTTGANLTATPVVVTWEVDEQSAFRVRLLEAGEPLTDSDWIGEPDTRAFEIPYELQNGQSLTIEVTTQNLAGFASQPQTVGVTVSLTPPPVPLHTETAVPDPGAIDVAIDNGTPGVGEDAADNNDLYRTGPDGIEQLIAVFLEADSTFRDYTVAHEVDYTYRVVARTAAGATISSA